VHDPRVSRLADADVGSALYDAIAKFLDVLGVPRGLKAVGYSKADVARLVDGTIPQRRVLDLAPGIGDVVGADGREALTGIIERSLEF
jgi:hydroxyacid-oxoacid transhydrogenase